MADKSRPNTRPGLPFFGKNVKHELRELVALGHINSWYYVGVRCHNPNVGSSIEDIWGVGGVQVTPATAGVASVVSDDAADTAAGTGARTACVGGLDWSYKEVSEDVTLNGTTPVVTTQEFLRVNSLEVLTSGSGEVNAGDITASVGGNVQRQIDAGDGICHCGQFCIPAGHTAYLFQIDVEQGQDSTTDVWLNYKTPASGTWLKVVHMLCWRSEVSHDFQGAVEIPEKSDIRMQGEAVTGTNDTTGYYVLLMVENGVT
tara:strand:+ start:29276 stop:30052 length:777 start_codon:yes stop_codon:yes gene_type:complete